MNHWPIAGLVVRTPRVELRWPTDDDLAALAELATEGVHDAELMPFDVPWTRGPAAEVARRVIQYHWLQRGQWTPESWSWHPVVVVESQVVGSQAVVGDQFAIRRTVATGSWLGQRHQGRGIGAEMRAAVLHLAFAGLGAARAETAANVDNAASLAVTRKLGYQADGTHVHAIEGQARLQLRFVLERQRWESGRRDDIHIDGLEPCLELFGAAPSP